MWLYGIFDWFADRPAARWAAGIGAAFATFWAWITLRDRRIRKQARKEAREEVIEQIEEQTDEALQRVEDDRAAVDRLNADQLRKLAGESPHNRGRLQNPEAD